MARTLMVAQQIKQAGIIPSAGTTPDPAGIKFLNDGRTFILVTNGSGASITLTLDTQETVQGLAITAPTVAVAAGASKYIGPFNGGIFDINSGADAGEVYIDFSAITTVTVNVFSLA